MSRAGHRVPEDLDPYSTSTFGTHSFPGGFGGLWPCPDAARAAHPPRRAGADSDPDTPGARVGAVGTARSAGGRARRPGSRGLAAGPQPPGAGTGRPPPAWLPPERPGRASAPRATRRRPHLPAHVQQRVIVFIVQLLLAQGRRHLCNLSPRRARKAVLKRDPRCAAPTASAGAAAPQRPLAAGSRATAVSARKERACALRPRAAEGWMRHSGGPARASRGLKPPRIALGLCLGGRGDFAATPGGCHHLGAGEDNLLQHPRLPRRAPGRMHRNPNPLWATRPATPARPLQAPFTALSLHRRHPEWHVFLPPMVVPSSLDHLQPCPEGDLPRFRFSFLPHI